MCRKSPRKITQHFKNYYGVNQNDYDCQKIANIIRRYQELRSAAEITAVQYQQVSGGNGFIHGKDDLVCVLADIDRGALSLSSRQQAVVEFLKKGYQPGEIGKMLGISPVTVKFHIQQAAFRLAAYLNTPHGRRKGANK